MFTEYLLYFEYLVTELKNMITKCHEMGACFFHIYIYILIRLLTLYHIGNYSSLNSALLVSLLKSEMSV